MTRSSAAIVLVLVGGTTLLGLSTCRSCAGTARAAHRVANFEHPIYQPGPVGLPVDFEPSLDGDALMPAPSPLWAGATMYRPYYGMPMARGLWYTWPLWTPSPFYGRYALFNTIYDPVAPVYRTTYASPPWWYWSRWGGSGWGGSSWSGRSWGGSSWSGGSSYRGGSSAPAPSSVSRGGFGSTGHAMSSGAS